MSDPLNPYAPPQSNIIVESGSAQGLPLASPWRRLGASLIDTIILMLFFTPAMFLGGYFTRTMERASHGTSWHVEAVLWGTIGFGILLAVNWSHLGRGQTIGKSVMKMRIVRKDGSPADRGTIILKRLLPLQVIGLVPVVGGLLVFVDSVCIFRAQHNTLHDDIADTKVVDLRGQVGL